MGVDVGYDPNFSDAANKQGVLYSWLNRFLCSNETGFGHDSNGYNEMATYQSMYALQWYLGFFEHGGAGFPYSLYYHQQDFSRALSKAGGTGRRDFQPRNHDQGARRYAAGKADAGCGGI